MKPGCENIKDETSTADESDRCESSTSGDDKDESGIEQDFEPKTNEQIDHLNIDHSSKELKKELESPKSPPVPALIPINLKSHLKRNDEVKTLNQRSRPGTIDQVGSSSEGSPEKSLKLIPSSNNKKQNSPYRPQFQRGPLNIKPTRQPHRNKAPEMFADIIIKDRSRTRSQYPSPVRKGILKHPNGSKYAVTGAKYAKTQKKNKLVSSKGMAFHSVKRY